MHTQFAFAQTHPKLLFGFHFGALYRANTLKSISSSYQLENKNSSGFLLGFDAYYQVQKVMKLRLSLESSFEEDKFVLRNDLQSQEMKWGYMYVCPSPNIIVQPVQKIPLGLVIGVSAHYGIKMGKESPENGFDLKSNYYTADVGFSYPIKLKSFTLSPEIKYAYSLSNSVGDLNSSAVIVDKYARNKFVFSLHFY